MDPDSSMLSSPSSHGGDQDYTFVTTQDEDEQDLFPDSTNNNQHQNPRPQTPQNNHLNAAAPGELSPPRSQSHTQPTMIQPDQADPLYVDNTHNEDDNGDINLLPKRKSKKSAVDPSSGTTRNTTSSTTNNNTNGGEDDTKWKAGSWKTKKSQDEMARAWENFVDKDFTCAAFPDPLAHRVQDGFLQKILGGAATGRSGSGSGGANTATAGQ